MTVDAAFTLIIVLAGLSIFGTYKLGRRFASKEEKERLKRWGD